MQLSAETLLAYEAFLSTLRRDTSHAAVRSVEMNLYGRLNPSWLLNELYFRRGQWLGFERFFQHYLALYEPEIMRRFGYKSRNEFEAGLRARLYRTQFGFLTEYHAFLLSAAFFGADMVQRSVDLDRSGVDFQVLIDSCVYNIHIFCDTANAWHYRRIKSAERRAEGMAGIHVNLPYALTEGRFNSVRYLPNGFGVYRESYLQYFLDEVRVGRVRDNNIVGTGGEGFLYG